MKSMTQSIYTRISRIMSGVATALFVVFGVLLAYAPVSADVDLIDSQAASSATGLGTATPTEIVAGAIAAFLGILGIIALIIIIFSGFQWMTAAGNKDKVEEAQDRLRAALIGLIIIIASYSIALWVFSTIEASTGFGQTQTQPQTAPGQPGT